MNQRKSFVETPLGKDALLLHRFQGREALSEPFLFELTLLGTQASIDPNTLLGKTMTVNLELPKARGGAGQVRSFHGYVTQLARLGEHGRFVSYGVQLRPWLWLLSMGSNCRIFQKKTVPEIVKEVCSGHGFTDIEQTLTGTYDPLEYCVQYRESDLAFVNRLLEREGIYYYFRHDKTKHTLVLADGPSAHQPLPNYAAIDFAQARGAADDTDDRIDSWQSVQHVQPGSYALDDYDFEKPAAELKVRLNAPKQHQHNKYEVYDYPGGYTKTGVGDRYARVRLQAQQVDFERVRGGASARGLAPGSTFKLNKFPVAAENASHLVVEANYRMTLDAYEARTGDAEPFRCEFTALKATVQFRPQRRVPRPVIAGLQTAKVVGPKGEELCTDEYGRVKVQFPWDRTGKFDERSSGWVRVAQLWAGSGWGTQHVPRIGQEVVVSFLEGDPDQPLITGSVYNGTNAPPFAPQTTPQISGIKTDSTKNATGFNELSFDDTKSAELINIRAQKNLAASSENDTTCSAKRNIAIDATKQLQLTAGTQAELKAGAALTVDGKTVLLTAAEELKLRVGLAEISLNAAGIISIKGTFVTATGKNLLIVSESKGLMRGMIVVPV